MGKIAIQLGFGIHGNEIISRIDKEPGFKLLPRR